MIVALLFSGLFLIVLLLALYLAPSGTRKTVGLLVVAGFLSALLKIWVFQQAPQWHDINPDSITYDLNGRAFALHWEGKPANAYEYKLQGLKVYHDANFHGIEWKPDERLPYAAAVVGSWHWLYAAYVGIWYWAKGGTEAAIWSNAVLAAFVLLLGGGKRGSLMAGYLTLLDPNVGVNASCLLKDTLVAFLTMASLWILIRILKEGNIDWFSVLLFPILSGLLGVLRFPALGALLVAFVGGSMLTWLLSNRKRVRETSAVFFATLMAFGLLAHFPNMKSAWHYIAGAPVQVIDGARQVWAASSNLDNPRSDLDKSHSDEAVYRWMNEMSRNPWMAAIKSAAHTLFAPYPWVAIYPGLTWRSFSELYYPGVVLWICCLPGIFYGLIEGVRSRDPAWWSVVVFSRCFIVELHSFYG